MFKIKTLMDNHKNNKFHIDDPKHSCKDHGQPKIQ